MGGCISLSSVEPLTPKPCVYDQLAARVLTLVEQQCGPADTCDPINPRKGCLTHDIMFSLAELKFYGAEYVAHATIRAIQLARQRASALYYGIIMNMHGRFIYTRIEMALPASARQETIASLDRIQLECNRQRMRAHGSS